MNHSCCVKENGMVQAVQILCKHSPGIKLSFGPDNAFIDEAFACPSEAFCLLEF